jgi:dATP pyrophosphohydrolase
MSRAPFQVLVLPYRIVQGKDILYAIFKRSDGNYWQGIAGGGEDDESPLDAAKREAHEEAGVDPTSRFTKLDSQATIPVAGICGFLWGSDVLVVPEYCFGVEVIDSVVTLSDEHSDAKWVGYESASEMLHWHSNKTALWELNHRLLRDRSACDSR